MAADESSLLDPKRLAQLLGVSKRTLYNWVRRGVFPEPFRMGLQGRTLRWTPTQVMNYLRARREALGRGVANGMGGNAASEPLTDTSPG